MSRRATIAQIFWRSYTRHYATGPLYLDTIIGHALAWEHKLMVKDAPAFCEAISA
jgi:hypothetical protein